MWALWYVLCTPNLYASYETSCQQIYEAMPNPAYRWEWQLKEVRDDATARNPKQKPDQYPAF